MQTPLYYILFFNGKVESAFQLRYIVKWSLRECRLHFTIKFTIISIA